MRASSLFTGALGVKAHDRALTSVADNIANVSTYGFKGTRALFSDLISRHLVQGGRESSGDTAGYMDHNQIGLGVVAQAVNVMNAASLTPTDINTDLGIEGQGFFIVKAPQHYTSPFGTVYANASDSGGSKAGSPDYYTRAGQFQIDRFGYITNTQGYVLQGVLADANGNVTMGPLQDLHIPEESLKAKLTSQINMLVNLDASDRAAHPDSLDINPLDGSTYNFSNGSLVYDSGGASHNIMLFYQRLEPVDSRSWKVEVFEKSGTSFNPVSGGEFRLYFDDMGQLTQINNPSADRYQALQGVTGNSLVSTVMGQSLSFSGAAGPETYLSGGIIDFAGGTAGGETVGIGAITYTLSAHSSREEAAADLAAQINRNPAAAGCFAVDEGSGRLSLQPLTSLSLPMSSSSSSVNLSAGATLDEVIYAIDNGRAASGVLLLDNVLAAGETVSIGGQNYTIPGGASPEEMAAGLVQLINDNSASPVSASALGGEIALSARSVGQAGNALLLSSSDTMGYLHFSSASLLGGMNSSEISMVDAQSGADPLNSSAKVLVLQRIGAGSGATITGLSSSFIPEGASLPLSFTQTSSASAGTPSSEGKATVNFNFDGLSQAVVLDYAPYGQYVPGVSVGQYTTQQALSSELRMITQDGYPEGFVNGMEINGYGDVLISYSNDQIRRIGTIALAHFPGIVELERIGDNLWLGNQASGGPWIDFPQTYQYGMGVIHSGNLEKSNVDMAQELVNMITYQRAYQFNTKSITTTDEMLKEAINMKR
ncbi:MAG: flagellar hook-basal body complex protein [Desulfarculales bacterium]|jgi:flagellar hook protein FlgE|nr:flagellar hook-basal body complex protein [Desulfarculales bacterium]